ncbi:MAG: hypothetical protein KUA37_13845 [Desulfomicrobium sp.]|nr:hypothetical protein [Desulfomicrobium sp.]
MFSRIVTILAMLTIAVVTTVTSAHAARMSAGANAAVHAIEVMQAHGNSTLHCVETEPCNAADAEFCAFVCAGLSVYLLLPVGDAGSDAAPDSHEPSYGAALMSRTPSLSERPPKLRLL